MSEKPIPTFLDAQREIAEQVRAMIPRLVDKRVSAIRENLIAEVLRRIDFESLSDDVLEVTSKRISVFGGSSVIPRINADTVDFLAPNAGNTVQNLAGSGGAALVGFLPSGTGAVAGTVQGELRKLVRASQFSGADFGVQLQAAHDAMPSTGGIIDCSDMTTTQSVATQVNITKPVWIELGNVTINGPTTGYMFKNTSADVTIEGRGGTNLVQGAGSSGIIQSVDVDKLLLKRFKIDLNNVANSKGIHILGGWYLCLEQIQSNKANVAASSSDLWLETTAAGSGSHGVFEGTGIASTFGRITMKGASGSARVTSTAFFHVDTAGVVENFTQGISFENGSNQPGSGVAFALGDVAGHVVSGMDIEPAAGTVYTFTGSCVGIKSLGNVLAGAGNTYLGSGNTLPANSRFNDYFGSAFTNSLNGDTEPWSFRNNGWPDTHSVGVHYSGDTVHFAANCVAISASQVNLINTGSGGILISIASNATWKIEFATSGANPRNLTTVLSGDSSGDIQWGKALVALGGGAAPTLGTIGGSGPAVAGQNTWMRVKDSAGNAFFVPAWK